MLNALLVSKCCLSEGFEGETKPCFREWRQMHCFVFSYIHYIHDPIRESPHVRRSSKISRSTDKGWNLLLALSPSDREAEWLEIWYRMEGSLRTLIDHHTGWCHLRGCKDLVLSTGSSLKSASLTSKLCTLRRMLRAVLSALFPLQHLLSPRATVPFLRFCCFFYACWVILFSLLRALEVNVSNWKTVSTLPVCRPVSMLLLSVGYSSKGLYSHSCPLSSFLCQGFFSGISLGLFGSCIFDHSLKSFVSQSGPFHHKGLSANSEGVAPLVHKPAGFSSVKTCCHCDGSVNIWISPIRLAMNGRKSLPRPRTHQRTSVLSIKRHALHWCF